MEPCIKENEIREIRDMTIEHRASFDYIKEKINVIESNHLVHIQNSLENMDKRMDGFDQFRWKVFAWSSVGAFLGSILIQLFFRKIGG